MDAHVDMSETLVNKEKTNDIEEKRSFFRISPINKRRWQVFKSNRRGYWSLWIFSILFLISLFAEFIANDRPYLILKDGKAFFPIFFDYTETDFIDKDKSIGEGVPAYYGDLEFVKLIVNDGGKIYWPPIRYSASAINYYTPMPGASKPFWLLDKEQICSDYPDGDKDIGCTTGNFNWLGTDYNLRDVLARVIYGFRLSVTFALILTIFSSVIGIIMGAIQGYFGGLTDLIMQRTIEIWASMPILYILLIIASFVIPGFWILLIILLLFSWVELVGVVRAEFLRGRNLEYVRAARALGVNDFKIMFKHILPNAMVATMTMLPFILSGAVTALTSLDYLGLGLPSDVYPSLGELLRQGKENPQAAPWLGITGFFVIAIMLSLMVFIGESIRDAFDPRKTFS